MAQQETNAQVFPRDSLKVHPPLLYPGYSSTVKRAPKRPLIVLPHTETELTGPAYGHESVDAEDADLTRQHVGEPLGERITVSGRVLDEDGRPVPNTLIEVWQANASGRYVHVNDQHAAPLDPNFSGAGRVVTDEAGPLQIHDDQARCLSLAQPYQRVAPGAHPFLALRTELPDASCHADVFPRRSAVRLRPHVQFGARPVRARAHGVALRTR